MNAPPQSVPRPPADIWQEMVDASIARDETRFAIARARYVAWLDDNGYRSHIHGSERPDGAIR